MTSTSVSLRGTALVAFQEIALAAAVAVLALAWLHIPDANLVEVLASGVFGLLIVAVAGAGQSAIALRLMHRPVTPRRLLPGTAAIVLAAALWYTLSPGIDHLSAQSGLYAGYLNSRFPASLRNIFSYPHLSLWLGWFWSALRCLTAGVLAAAAFACTVADKPLHATLAILRSAAFWLSLVLLDVVAAVVAGRLLGWTPGHGLAVEMLSLILRLGTITVLLAGSIALLLQAMARAVLRAQSAGRAEP